MAEQPVYQIRDWDKIFENAQSRKYQKLNWVAMPNGHDGDGYRQITEENDAAEIYCAWSLIVQVGSKMPVRGVLRHPNGPVTPAYLARKTAMPTRIFERAFEVCSRPDIGWLEPCDSHPTPTRLPPDSHHAGLTRPPKGRKEERKKGYRSDTDTPLPSVILSDTDTDGGNHRASFTPSKPASQHRSLSGPIGSGDLHHQEEEVGSDGTPAEEFKREFVDGLCLALNLSPEAATRNQRPFFAMASTIIQREDRFERAYELIALAKSKVREGAKNPVRAFQAEFNRMYPKRSGSAKQ